MAYRYDFEAYTEASEKMYRVFLRYAPVVMAVSCDEAFLELAEGTNPMEAATRVRRGLETLALLSCVLRLVGAAAHRRNALYCFCRRHRTLKL